jgi:outer membrane protein
MISPFHSFILRLVDSMKVYPKYIVLFLTCFLLSFHGQSAKAEDLMQVYGLANENDPTFQSQKSRHEASIEIYKQAYSELLPTLSMDSYYQRTRQKIYETDVSVYGDNLAYYPSKGYNLTLTQPIFKYSSLMRLTQAKEEVKSADLEFQAAEQDLMLRTAEAYIGALEAYDNLEYSRSEEESVKLHFELAKERYTNGLAPITDFHDAKARFAYVTALRIEAENALDDALEAIVEIIGQKIDNPARLIFNQDASLGLSAASEGGEATPGAVGEAAGGEMPLMSPDPDNIEAWTEAAQGQNFKVQIQKQKLLIAKQEIERQKAGYLPTLTFVARINRDYEGGSLFGGDSDLGTREAMLQLNIPLFRGFSVVSKTREARTLSEAVEQELEKEIRLAKREARAAFLGVKTAIKNTEALRQSVVSSGIALDAKKEGFKSGLFPSLSVLDAERDLHQSKYEYSKARYDYILNSLRLKKAVGTLSEEDLEGINKWLE